jgi:hypothetical protein
MRCAAPDLHAAENDVLHVAWHAVGQACCTLWQTDPDEPTPELKFIGSLRLSVHEARAYTRMRTRAHRRAACDCAA